MASISASEEVSGGRKRAANGSPAVLRDLLPALALAAAGLLALAAGAFAVPSRGEYVVIGPPWADQGATIALIGAAGGGLAGLGGWGNIAIAASGRADFAQAAREAGAWLVLPAPRLLGCITSPGEPS